MKINIKAVKQLIKEKFNNKLILFVREINVDYSYMNQIMNNKRPADSKKVCDGIIKYCKKNNLDYTVYIFF